MLKNRRGNVSLRIDHVQSGAKQSTPNPRKKGEENKAKQNKTKNSNAQQSTTNTTKHLFMFFRLGAKKKTNRNHASRWRHGPDKEELANHEVSCDSKFQPAQHLAKAQKKTKKNTSAPGS
jgi:hypothetical protein